MANLPQSMPIHLRPNFSATARVVPEPAKASKIKSPLFEDAEAILSSNFSGF